MSGYVERVRAHGGSTARTGSGLGLSSSRFEVEKARGQGEWTSGKHLRRLDEDARVGLYFKFMGANLAEITSASPPE